MERKVIGENMKAAEYVAKIADTQPISTVAEEIKVVTETSPTVKQAVSEFWCDFWREIARRYGNEVST